MHETNDSRRPEVGNLQLSQPGDYTHLLPELSQCYTLRTHMKQALASVLKAVAGIAGLVFLLAPVTGMGILVSVIGLVVAIVGGVTSSHLSDDDGQSGYWPKGPVPNAFAD